jgi:HK97 family phage prohead protease
MKLPKKLYRAVNAEFVKRDGQDESGDTLRFSFSSEAPVERWFGEEILSHERGCADLSRMNDGANLLWNHDPDKVIGVIEKSEIGADKRGYVDIRWGTSALAQEKRKDVEAGVIRNVSFGYQIKEMTCTNPGAKSEEPRYLATRWMPYEASFVSVPADQSVGVGRSETGEGTEVKVTNPLKGEKHKMTEEEKRLAAEAAAKAEQERKAAEIRVRDEAISAERARSAAINALGERFKKSDLARQLVDGGKSVEEARAAFLDDAAASEQKFRSRAPKARVGMS